MEKKEYENQIKHIQELLQKGKTDEAKKELKALFDGDKPFDTPKPTRLMDRIIHIATEENALILDFFAGSGT